VTSLVLTVNVHGIGPEAATAPEADLFGKFAHGRYAYRAGLQRVLDAFAAFGVRATFFWPVSEIERAPALFERCLSGGHEIAAHGIAFEDLSKIAPAAEEDLLAVMTERLTRAAGAPPRGFRSATGTLSPRTFANLARLGYAYDASMIDDDDAYDLGPDGAPGLIELPWFEALSDATHYARRFTQARARAVMLEEMDALLPVAGYASLTLHPRSDIGSARAARLALVEELITRARTRFGGEATTCEGFLARRGLSAAR